VTVTTGNETVGADTPRSGADTEAVVGPVTSRGLDSVWRGDACFGLSVADGADGADDVGFGTTTARGRSTRTRERCRLGSGEACGSLCPEPETESACGRIRTADACGSRPASRAEGEADPTPKSTIALYRTAEAAVAERPSLQWPPGLCLASPINPLSG